MTVEATLAGRVALVTGASRGIGKGIAVELGARGATVYVTARSVEPGFIPGTIGETVAAIDAAGGKGIGCACDHRDDAAVERVIDQIRDVSGRLDVLVNNVFSAPDMVPWLGKAAWEIPVSAWDQVIGVGARSHYVATALALPLLLATPGTKLVANISSSGSVQYAHNVVYGIGKAAVDKLTADLDHELRARDEPVAVVSLWPGLVRTELLDLGASHDDAGAPYIDLPGEGRFFLDSAETPRFVGRAVAALAGDPGVVAARSGRCWQVATLANEYGFTDVDGRVPTTVLRPSATPHH